MTSNNTCPILLFGYMALALITSVGYGETDPYAETWHAHSDGIKTFEVSFSRERSDRPGKTPQQHWLRMDIETEWFRGTAIKTRVGNNGNAEILEDEYGLHDKASWDSTRMRDGTKRIDIDAIDKGTPKDSKLVELGYTWLKWCFLPFHSEITKEFPQAKFALISESKSQSVSGANHLVYNITVGDNVFEIAYDIQFNDGVRIHNTEVRNGDQLLYKISNSDFKKAQGVWIAHKSIYQEFAPGSDDPKYRSVINLSNISVNSVFNPKDFYPDVLDGDKVVDHLTGMNYRVGTTGINLQELYDLPINVARETQELVDSTNNSIESQLNGGGKNQQISDNSISEEKIRLEKNEAKVQEPIVSGKKGGHFQISGAFVAKSSIFVLFVILVITVLWVVKKKKLNA